MEETREEFRDRMRSIGFLGHGRIRDRVETITRPETDSGLDAGRKAKRTTDQLGTVITESEHRQDVNITPATYVAELDITQG